MTGKYAFPSALSSQETFYLRSLSLLLLHFHTQCSAPEPDPPPLVGTWDGSSTPKWGHSPTLSSAVWLCTALDCSSQTTTPTQFGRQGSFILPEAGPPLRKTYLQLSSGFQQGFASAASRGWPHWQWGLAFEGTLPNP